MENTISLKIKKIKTKKEGKRNVYSNILQIILDLCNLRSGRILYRNNMVLDRFSGVFQQDEQSVFPDQLCLGLRRRAVLLSDTEKQMEQRRLPVCQMHDSWSGV